LFNYPEKVKKFIMFFWKLEEQY